MTKKDYLPGRKGNAVLYYFTVDKDTNEFIAYYPMPISSSSSLPLAGTDNYDKCWVKLGVSPKKFLAVMVPCNHPDSDPSKQIRMAMKLSAFDIHEQATKTKETRCLIPSKKGLWKRCPNSKNCYGTGNNDKCPYADFKHNSTIVPFSELECDNDEGESEPFAIVSTISPEEDTQYHDMCDSILQLVHDSKPKFYALAELRVGGHDLASAEKILGKSHGTVWYQNEQLKKISQPFLDNVTSIQSSYY